MMSSNISMVKCVRSDSQTVWSPKYDVNKPPAASGFSMDSVVKVTFLRCYF